MCDEGRIGQHDTPDFGEILESILRRVPVKRMEVD